MDLWEISLHISLCSIPSQSLWSHGATATQKQWMFHHFNKSVCGNGFELAYGKEAFPSLLRLFHGSSSPEHLFFCTAFHICCFLPGTHLITAVMCLSVTLVRGRRMRVVREGRPWRNAFFSHRVPEFTGPISIYLLAVATKNSLLLNWKPNDSVLFFRC